MKGLKIDFKREGAELLPETVEGFQCVVQNALVNTATEAGTDPVYPDRGTKLFRTATSGAIVDASAAAHASNFAAVRTLYFSRTHDYPDQGERLAEFKISPVSVEGDLLKLNIQCVSTSGTTVGTSYILN